MRKSAARAVPVLCLVCCVSLAGAFSMPSCSRNFELALMEHRYDVTKETSRIKDLDAEFFRVEPDGAVVVWKDGKLYTAGVGQRFDGPGMLHFLYVESSDPTGQTATLCGVWCERRRIWWPW